MMKFKSTIDLPLVPTMSVKLGQASYGRSQYKLASSPKWFEPTLLPKWLVWIEGDQNTYSVENKYSVFKANGPMKINKDDKEIGELIVNSKQIDHGSFSISCNKVLLNFNYAQETGYQAKDKNDNLILTVSPSKPFQKSKWEDIEVDIEERLFEPTLVGLAIIYRFALEDRLGVD